MAMLHDGNTPRVNEQHLAIFTSPSGIQEERLGPASLISLAHCPMVMG